MARSKIGSNCRGSGEPDLPTRDIRLPNRDTFLIGRPSNAVYYFVVVYFLIVYPDDPQRK
eukprot:3394828-Prymnesium_polylepis.1